MKLKQFIFNAAIVLVSTIVALSLCEALARAILNPADYLSVNMVKHEILGGAIAPHTAGFDEWGFRNTSVPETVDIVAIGDSHTYGNTARMADAWPYSLSQLTGKSVYNMGLGGYGPNQYYYLLKARALSLKPRVVLCGLYMGDDFENAFLITYGLDYWSFLRQGHFDGADPNIWKTAVDNRWFKGIRVWLSENSVIYQLVFHGPILGRIKGYIQVGNVSRGNDENVTSLILEEKNIREAFRPIGIRDRNDQKNEAVREGMRITLELLNEMNKVCLQNNIQYVVVVIPTKEMVFAEYLEKNPKIHLGEVIDELLVNERMARGELFKFFRENEIRYVDTLPALKRAVENELYARTDQDMHPGKNGYRVIAEAVAESLKDQDLPK